ncbi:MAG: signal peptidase II, partial [Candidatus Moraniibacteriota bacterium]
PTAIIWLGIGIFLGLALYQILSLPASSERLAWASILFGGFINALDRLLHGCVQDYLHFAFFPSFNLADIMLFLGVVFLLITTLGVFSKAKSYVS